MNKMRGPNPIRGLRQGREDRDTRASRTEHLEDQATAEMKEQYLQQIGRESLQAAKTAREVFYYYRRKRTGRHCSCFTTETSPDGFCQICYGAGFVGGWDLHGCRSEWIDITYPNISMVNVEGNFDAGQRPVCFVLSDGARSGFIETRVDLVRNTGVVQKIQQTIGNKRFGTGVTTYIRTPIEPNYTVLTEASLAARLNQSQIFLKSEITRSNTSLPSPKLSHIMLRYQLIPEVKMFGDRNLAEESHELGDLGFTDAFTILSLYVPNAFDRLSTDDFLVRLSDQKRFKVTTAERNAVLETHLSTLIRARLLLPRTDSLVVFP